MTTLLAGDRRRVAARRRHRDHEHHAGVGHRADARDRPAHGHRRARQGRAAAVPGRGHRPQPAWRPHRASAWASRFRRGRKVPRSGRRPFPPNAIAMAFGFAAATGVFFGFYPATKGGAAGPDRSAAVRIDLRRRRRSSHRSLRWRLKAQRSGTVDSRHSFKGAERMKRARIGIIATAVLAVATWRSRRQAGLLRHLDAGRRGGSGRQRAAAAGRRRWWRRRPWRRRPDDGQADRRHAHDRADEGDNKAVPRPTSSTAPRARSRWARWRSQGRRRSGTAASSSSPPRPSSGEQTQTWSLAGGILTIERTGGRGPSKTIYKKTT